MGKYKIFY